MCSRRPGRKPSSTASRVRRRRSSRRSTRSSISFPSATSATRASWSCGTSTAPLRATCASGQRRGTCGRATCASRSKASSSSRHSISPTSSGTSPAKRRARPASRRRATQTPRAFRCCQGTPSSSPRMDSSTTWSSMSSAPPRWPGRRSTSVEKKRGISPRAVPPSTKCLSRSCRNLPRISAALRGSTPWMTSETGPSPCSRRRTILCGAAACLTTSPLSSCAS
mmetsp:Transcript_23394/g.73382  ORF Transcript_23394/g.73382 Transcript_23394/m.73382 type:complete len:224 (+) Transcript_23394:1388-2059(+)